MGALCRSYTRKRRPFGREKVLSRWSSWRRSRSRPAPPLAPAATAASADASADARERPAQAYRPPAVAAASRLRRVGDATALLLLLPVLPGRFWLLLLLLLLGLSAPLLLLLLDEEVAMLLSAPVMPGPLLEWLLGLLLLPRGRGNGLLPGPLCWPPTHLSLLERCHRRWEAACCGVSGLKAN